MVELESETLMLANGEHNSNDAMLQPNDPISVQFNTIRGTSYSSDTRSYTVLKSPTKLLLCQCVLQKSFYDRHIW